MPTARVLDALHVLVRPGEDPSDGDCLQRFLAHRDEAAFAELVRRHGPTVYGACRRILGGGPEADDAFQATFFVLARKAGSIRSAAAVAGWLYGVAVKVAHKARVQAVKRRVRQMAAAKPEAVHPSTPEADLWAVLDDELAKLPADLRQAVLTCDVGGKSRSQAARELGWPEGTVAKRLAKGRETLAKRLTRRGISLSVGALSVALCERATAAVPGALLAETARQATAFAAGGGVGSLAVQALAEGVLRSLKVGAFKMWVVVGLLAMTLAGGSLMSANGPGEGGEKKAEQPPAAKPEAAKGAGVWKENYAVEYPGALPVSVAFAPDGKTLLTGDTTGEVMALTFPEDRAVYRWKTKVGGSHAAVAYSANGKRAFATTTDGVYLMEAATGKGGFMMDARESHSTVIAAFPDKEIGFGQKTTRGQIIHGSARGYFITSWIDPSPQNTPASTIEVQTRTKDATDVDEGAVPLAVDPRGRSAIITGPVDPKSNRNILWAYACGDYGEGSPGNRILTGHVARVVSAAWAKEGSVAVTGDADGRVIVWDAKTMKETRRLELGGRVAALAISDDGTRTAAYVLGKRVEVYVWDTAKPTNTMAPIHSEAGGFNGPTSFASLSFSPDGKRLAGCAGDKKALNRLGELVGKVRVWELVAEPKAQPAPKPAYTITLPKGSSANFVVLNNESMIVPAGREGAIDFRNVREGYIQFRLDLGKFAIGGLKLSADRRWLAIDQHAPANQKAITDLTSFSVGVWDMKEMKLQATIPDCEQTLDIAAGGKVVAVRRAAGVEVWDAATAKKLKAAPFKTIRIDAAAFSPDGKLLAISDRNDLVLWRWEDGTYERIALGRCVGSLTFSPDGKFLAEGPTPRENLQIRDVESRNVVQALSNGTKLSMNVPRMAYAQGGRVLIACDNGTFIKEIVVPHRINLWDTASGGIAHQIALPAGLPYSLDVTPNGRYLVAALDDGDSGMKLSGWRLDGATPAKEAPSPPPAAATPAGKVMWKEGKPIPIDRWPASALAVSPDGTMLAVAVTNTVSIYDPATGARLDKGRVANLKAPATTIGLAFSPSGKLAVTCEHGVAIFDHLLDDIPSFFGGPKIWEGVKDFDPHQLVFLDEVKPAGWSNSKDARLVATNGATFKELGWTYTNNNGVEGWEKHAGETWESWESYRRRPTLLASAPGTNRVIHAAGPAAAGEPDAFNVYARLTDVTPHAVRTMPGHAARPTAGAVSPDGKLFLSGDEAGDLIAWDGTTFQKARQWKLGGTVAAVALAADNATAAVFVARDVRGGTDWELYLFDATQPAGPLQPFWKPDAPLPVSPARAATLAFHPDGTKLYGVYGDTTYKKVTDPDWRKPVGIRVWERDGNVTKVEPPLVKLTWKAEPPLTDPQYDVRTLAVSPDGKRFAAQTGSKTRVFDAATLKELYLVNSGFPRFVGADLLTWGAGAVRYDAATGTEVKQYPKPKLKEPWTLAAFSPDGKSVAGFDYEQVQLRDVATGFEPVRLDGQGKLAESVLAFLDGSRGTGLAWSPDGKRVAGFHRVAEGGRDGGLAVWDAADGKVLGRTDSGRTVKNNRSPVFAFSPNGKTIAAGGLDEDNEKNTALALFDAGSLKDVQKSVPVRSRDGGADVTAIAYSPDGATIAIGVKLHSGKDPLNRVQLFDAKTLELRDSLLPDPDTAPITALAFAPDGRTLITATGEGPFSDPQKREILHRILIWRGEPAK